MNSDALETFLAVHRCGGVSAAAGELARTQSAISRRLAMLEAQVQAPLFERIGRGLVLSEIGAALLPHAERVLAALGDAQSAVDAARSGPQGTVHLATVGTLADHALAATLAQVRDACPGLDLRLHTATSAQVSALVRTGEVTLGLRYFASRAADLHCRVVAHERLVVACAPSHPLAGRRVPSLASLAGERWLAFPVHAQRPENFAATVAAQFTTRGLDEIDFVWIDGLTAQKRLVEAGFGIAMLQLSAIEEELRHGELAQVEVADFEVRIPVALVVRKGAHLSGPAMALLQALSAGAQAPPAKPRPVARRRRA